MTDETLPVLQDPMTVVPAQKEPIYVVQRLESYDFFARAAFGIIGGIVLNMGSQNLKDPTVDAGTYGSRGVANMHKLAIGQAMTICGTILLIAAFRGR